MRDGPPSKWLVNGLKTLRLRNLSYYEMLYNNLAQHVNGSVGSIRRGQILVHLNNYHPLKGCTLQSSLVYMKLATDIGRRNCL